MACSHLTQARINEQRDRQARILQRANQLAQRVGLRRNVKATLSGDLLPALGNERHHVRLVLVSHFDHLRSSRHLQVQLRLARLAQKPQVPLLDVPAIFTQVQGNLLSPSDLRQGRGQYRIGIANLSGLPHGGHVVNVNSESWAHPFSLSHLLSDSKTRSGVTRSGATLLGRISQLPANPLLWRESQ